MMLSLKRDTQSIIEKPLLKRCKRLPKVGFLELGLHLWHKEQEHILIIQKLKRLWDSNLKALRNQSLRVLDL